jgi:hypothetical protein
VIVPTRIRTLARRAVTVGGTTAKTNVKRAVSAAKVTAVVASTTRRRIARTTVTVGGATTTTM